MKFTVNLDGRDLSLEATRRGEEIHLTYEGRTTVAVVVAHSEDSVTLRLGDRRIQLHVHAAGDERQVWVDGRTFSFHRRRQAGNAPSVGRGTLASTIPAVVAEILVAEGDVVNAGDKLILLESMKMVIPIVAPEAGRVTALHCAVGEAVQPGVELIEIAG